MEYNSLIGRIGSVLGVLIAFVIILFCAYIATKFIGKRMTIRSVGNKNINIIESVSLGQNKALLIVESAGKTFLLGMTQNKISLISELEGEKIISHDKSTGETMEFSKAFKTVLENNFGKKIGRKKENDNDSNKK